MTKPSLPVVGPADGRELSPGGTGTLVERSSFLGRCLAFGFMDGDAGGSFLTIVFEAGPLRALSQFLLVSTHLISFGYMILVVLTILESVFHLVV